MQRIILQVGPNVDRPLFLSRLTTVSKLLLPKLPASHKSVHSRQFLRAAGRNAEKWRILQRFLANAAADTMALWLSVRAVVSLTPLHKTRLFTAVSLLYVV